MKRLLSLCLALLLLLTACGALDAGEEEHTPDPTPEQTVTAPEPETEPEPEPEPEPDVTVTLAVCGDAMCHIPQSRDAYDSATGTYDYTPSLQYVRPWLEAADFALCNLETVMAGGALSAFPRFNCPDDFASSLAAVGFDLISTANNHSLDQGFAGLSRTLDVLDEAGLAHVGTWRTQEEFDENQGVYLADIGGIRVAFLAYTYGANGFRLPSDKPFAMNFFNVDYATTLAQRDYDKLDREMAYARSLEPDCIAVIVHWGIEYKTQQNSGQEELADYFIAQGADLVLGGHPHVPQPMEVRTVTTEEGETRQGFVCYSLGNFTSAQSDPYTTTTAVLNLELTRSGQTGETTLTGISYVPLSMVNRGTGSSPRFLLMDVHQALEEGNEYVTAAVQAQLETALDQCHEIWGEEWDIANQQEAT